MKILETYALLKAKIKQLEDEVKLLSPEIQKEVEENGKPIKEAYGTFSMITSSIKSYTYSETVKDAENTVETMKAVEVANGTAQAEVKEKTYLKFLPERIALPPGAYNWDNVKNLQIN